MTYISPTTEQIKAMDDHALDQAYGAAREAVRDKATRSLGAADMQRTGDEIVRRVQSFTNMLMDAVRKEDRFPVYYGVTNFSGAAAASFKDSAGSLAGGIGETLGKILGPSAPVIALVVIGIIVLKVKFK